MKSKQIIFTRKEHAELVDVEVQNPTGQQVLVELAFSTVSSGTERANIIGDANTNPHSKGAAAAFPRWSGYSSAGTVLAVGEDVKTLKKGDRVALSWSCHTKYCLIDEEKNVHKIEFDDVSFEDAAVCHIGTFSLSAIRKCRLEIGESAIVMGLGVLGLAAIQLLKTAGAYPVIAVDPIARKREFALSLGADYAFDPFEEGFAEKIKAITGGGVNVAIEVTGNGKALDMVLDCMAKFGRVALLGCTRNSDFTIDYYRKVHGPGVSLIGAHTHARPDVESHSGNWTTKDDALALIKLVHGGRISLKALIEETHIPQECEEVYSRLVHEKDFPVVQFDWRNI